MYKYYMVPDATTLSSHAEIYTQMQLFWDPRAESDAYAIVNTKSKEEVNKAGSLEFQILPANIHYNDFHKKKTVVVVYDDDTWLFEGVVSECPVDFYKQRKVTVTSALSYLCDSVQPPDEKNTIEVPTTSGDQYKRVPASWYENGNPKKLDWYEKTFDLDTGETIYTKSSDTTASASKNYYTKETGDGSNHSGQTVLKKAATKETIGAHLTRLLDVHNSQIDHFKMINIGQVVDDSTQENFSSSNYRSTWDCIKSDIIDEFGRYLRVRLGNDHNLYLDYLDIKQMSSARPVIEFTKNMIEMSESNDTNNDIFTVLVPTGKDNLTVKDVAGHDSPSDDSPYIVSWGGNRRYVVVSRDAINRYGYIVKPQSFSDVSTAAELWTRSEKYIKNNYDYHNEYNVKAIDGHFIDPSVTRISVYDKCILKSNWHGVNERDLFIITSEQDHMNPENDSYRIGIPTSDREAFNRTLTGQSNKARKSARDNSASANSGVSRLGSILEDYIHVTEWGLEMNSRLKNEVESADQKYKTRFIQDEEQISIAAEKLFGIDADGVGDLDAGYIQVLTEEYRKDDGKGSYKSPKDEHWFEKQGNQYVLSNDTTCDPDIVGNKTYYKQRLWSRYSRIQVEPGGIKARVDGNYERSTASSSWIEANEEALLAITGHVHVDENGQVIIDAGAGARTGYRETITKTRFIQVPKSWRQNYSESPHLKGWYERKLDKYGNWEGAGKSDSETNENYYVVTPDIHPYEGHYYYYKSITDEEFVAEYGIYDKGNLTAGIIVSAINNPGYIPVSYNELHTAGKNPNASGWYVLNTTTGTYGLSTDTRVVEGTEYFKRDNNYDQDQTYTFVKGSHIVIGAEPETTYVQIPKEDYPIYRDAGTYPKKEGWYEKRSDGTYYKSTHTMISGTTDYYKKKIGYNDMSPAMKAKVMTYITENNLDGSITEIASDVVTVNALFARFIHFDDAEGDTIKVYSGKYDILDVSNDLNVHNSTNDAKVTADILYVNDTATANIMQTDYLSIGGTGFGTMEYEGGESETKNDPSDIVMAFDTPTYSGDNVTIKFRTAGMEDFDDDAKHQITFTKPASIGAVTWSDGTVYHQVKVETAGGKTFFVGNVKIPTNYTTYSNYYAYANINNHHSLDGLPILELHMDITADWTNRYDPSDIGPMNPVPAEPTVWEKDIFVDTTVVVNDTKSRFGISGPLTASADDEQEAQAEAAAPQLTEYDSYYMFYSTYRNPSNNNTSRYSDKQYFKTPPVPAIRTYANYDDKDYDGESSDNYTVELDYDDEVLVYPEYKIGDEWHQSNNFIKVTSKPDNSGPTITSDNIDIPNDGFDTNEQQPSGMVLNNLKNAILSAISEEKWLYFTVKVTGTSASKRYVMDFR